MQKLNAFTCSMASAYLKQDFVLEALIGTVISFLICQGCLYSKYHHNPKSLLLNALNMSGYDFNYIFYGVFIAGFQYNST